MKKKILLISCKGLGKGGVQAVLMSIVRKLSHLYIFDIVLLTNAKGYYEEEFLSYGGNIYRIPVYDQKKSFLQKFRFFFMPFLIYKGTRDIIKNNGPYCAIHCNNYYESAYCLKAAHLENIPVRICHIHACMNHPNKLVEAIRKQNLRQIEKFSTNRIACSDRAYASVFGNKETPDVFVNSYNAQKFNRSNYIKENPENLIITQVGYFSPNKNQLFSIRVLSHLKNHLPDVRMNLVGFDVNGYKAILDKEIDLLGLNEHVTFWPSDADIPKLLSKSTLSMIPSKAEGFCIVAVESQAMGVPVFASDALPNASNAGGCMYLPLELGPEVWANKILEWYQENKNNAYNFDCTKFEEDSVIQKYKELYEGK